MRSLTAPLVIVVAVLAIVEGRLTAARATIQQDMCIEPDIEYPVPCEDDDDGSDVGAYPTPGSAAF